MLLNITELSVSTEYYETIRILVNVTEFFNLDCMSIKVAPVHLPFQIHSVYTFTVRSLVKMDFYILLFVLHKPFLFPTHGTVFFY